jgi:hypothetical protein
MHGPNTANGYIGVSNNPASDFDVMGSLPFPGTRRLRIDKLGNTLTFSIDQDHSGTFVPDLSYVVADIAATAPFLTGQNTHLFFGTAIARDYFDDVAVEVLTPPGVLSNDTDDDGDVLSAELTSGPSHGTLTLLNNGTFTYQPEPGFLGTDSFTYVALDAELRSDPAEVTIVVSSTNVAPVGVADHYEIAQDSNLEAKRRTGVDLNLDFEDGTLFPYLEATGFFVVQDGALWARHSASSHSRNGASCRSVPASPG